MAACRAGDTLVVPKLDRLARSLPDARAIMEELAAGQVKLNLGGSVHDPADPVGRLLFNVLAMVAEFEADLIRLRTQEDMQAGICQATDPEGMGASWSFPGGSPGDLVRARDAGPCRWAGGQPVCGDRNSAALAHLVLTVHYPLGGSVEVFKLDACVPQHGLYLGPFERDRGALRIVLVVVGGQG